MSNNDLHLRKAGSDNWEENKYRRKTRTKLAIREDARRAIKAIDSTDADLLFIEALGMTIEQHDQSLRELADK